MDDVTRHARQMRSQRAEAFAVRAAQKNISLLHIASDEQGHETDPNDLEETFVLGYQRRTSISDLWIDGRQIPASFKQGTFATIDLRETAVARMHTGFDALHFVIPKRVIDGIAARSGAIWTGKISGRETGVVDPVAENILTCLFETLDSPGPANQLLGDHLTLALHVHFAKTYGGMSPGLTGASTMEATQVRLVKDMLASRLDDEVTLVSIASQAGLCRRALIEGFRNATGYTPQAWQAEYRILTAKSLLRDRSLSLADVAIRCGFADQSHFTRTFGRATGTSPGAWRKDAGA